MRDTSTSCTSHPLALDELGERAAGRREEDDAVAAGAGGARELQRHDLPARDVAADHEVRDRHGRRGSRQTPTSSVALSIALVDDDPLRRDGLHRRGSGGDLARLTNDADVPSQAQHVELPQDQVTARLGAPLPEELDLVEVAPEERLEVRGRVLDVVVGVVRALVRPVDPRRRDEQDPVVA